MSYERLPSNVQKSPHSSPKHSPLHTSTKQMDATSLAEVRNGRRKERRRAERLTLRFQNEGPGRDPPLGPVSQDACHLVIAQGRRRERRRDLHGIGAAAGPLVAGKGIARGEIEGGGNPFGGAGGGCGDGGQQVLRVGEAMARGLNRRRGVGRSELLDAELIEAWRWEGT